MSGQRRHIHREMTPANEVAFRGLVRELQSQGRSERTISSYHDGCLSLEDYLRSAGRPADLLAAGEGDVMDWMIALRTGGGWSAGPGGALVQRGAPASKDTILAYFGDVRRLYKWAVKNELIDESPVAAIATPRGTSAPVPVPDVDLVRAMIATTRPGTRKRGFINLRDEAIIRLALETGGMRRGELATALLARTDLLHDQLEVHGKGDRRRLIVMSKTTAMAVTRYLAARAAHPHAARPELLIGRHGSLTGEGLYKIIRGRARAAGGDLHPHQLRHLSADMAKADQMSDGDMMIMFGWTSPRMLLRYGAARAQARALDASRRHAIGDRL